MTENRGVAALLTSTLCFALMAVFVKVAAATVPPSEVAVFRFLIVFVPILLIPKIRAKSFQYTRLLPLVLRGLFGGLAVLLYFVSVAHIPVGVASLLNSTSPVFSGILAAIFLGERLTVRNVGPLVITIIGVVLVVTGHSTPDETLGFGKWELAGLASAVCAAAAVTAMRGARRTESTWSILFFLSIFGLIVTLPAALPVWKAPSPREWLFILLAGTAALLAQILMTWAYRWVETLAAGIISQLGVVIATILGVVYLGDVLTLLTVVGIAISITGVATMIIFGRARPAAVLAE
ncbi:MAG TPA: DMT family transporter [Thermoanaerobaculia bacterium]|nr:DMT family transporter [Thermoanaerobaculia bacterium]